MAKLKRLIIASFILGESSIKKVLDHSSNSLVSKKYNSFYFSCSGLIYSSFKNDYST